MLANLYFLLTFEALQNTAWWLCQDCFFHWVQIRVHGLDDRLLIHAQQFLYVSDTKAIALTTANNKGTTPWSSAVNYRVNKQLKESRPS